MPKNLPKQKIEVGHATTDKVYLTKNLQKIVDRNHEKNHINKYQYKID